LGKLKIYIDENVDISIAKGLTKQGIEVFTAVDEGLIGQSDMEHFNYARKINAVLFTQTLHHDDFAFINGRIFPTKIEDYCRIFPIIYMTPYSSYFLCLTIFNN